jgi:hypothetical protein
VAACCTLAVDAGVTQNGSRGSGVAVLFIRRRIASAWELILGCK